MDYFDSFDCQFQCEDFFDNTTYYLDEYYRDFSDELEEESKMQFAAKFDTPMAQFLDEF